MAGAAKLVVLAFVSLERGARMSVMLMRRPYFRYCLGLDVDGGVVV